MDLSRPEAQKIVATVLKVKRLLTKNWDWLHCNDWKTLHADSVAFDPSKA
jgi:hypothetical protein